MSHMENNKDFFLEFDPNAERLCAFSGQRKTSGSARKRFRYDKMCYR